MISLATKRNIATECQTARCWQWSQIASLIKPVESHGHSCVGCGLELCNANNDDDKLANLSLFLESAQNATHLQAQKTEPVGTVANKGGGKKRRKKNTIYIYCTKACSPYWDVRILNFKNEWTLGNCTTETFLDLNKDTCTDNWSLFHLRQHLCDLSSIQGTEMVTNTTEPKQQRKRFPGEEGVRWQSQGTSDRD